MWKSRVISVISIWFITLISHQGQRHSFLRSQSLFLGSGVSRGILQGSFSSSSTVTLQVLDICEMGNELVTFLVNETKTSTSSPPRPQKKKKKKQLKKGLILLKVSGSNPSQGREAAGHVTPAVRKQRGKTLRKKPFSFCFGPGPQPMGWCCQHSGLFSPQTFLDRFLQTHVEVCFHGDWNSVTLTTKLFSFITGTSLHFHHESPDFSQKLLPWASRRGCVFLSHLQLCLGKTVLVFECIFTAGDSCTQTSPQVN